MIGYELYRNIGLAMICIFVISLTMLADVKISLMVMACVILTMVRHMKMNWYIHPLWIQWDRAKSKFWDVRFVNKLLWVYEGLTL